MAKSGIHINPKNKGKFTATKKKTGKSTEELTHSKNPLTKKRAIFSQNAKKWHHGDDGLSIESNDPQMTGLTAPQNPLLWGNAPDINDPNASKTLSYFGNGQVNKKPADIKDSILAGLSVLDRVLPYHPEQLPINRQTTYNQNPYGTGSEAMFDNGGMKPLPYNPGMESKLQESSWGGKNSLMSGLAPKANPMNTHSWFGNKSNKAKFDDGGMIDEGGPGKPVSTAAQSNLYKNWNRVVDYAKSKNYTPDQLDHDSNVGFGIINQYNKLNPDNQFDPTKVKDIQTLMNQYRQKTIDGFKQYTPQMLAVNDPTKQYGADYSGFMPGLSKEDNFPGHRTLGWKVPVEYMPNSTQTMSGPIKGFAPITRGTTSSDEDVPLRIKQDDHSDNPAAAAYLRSQISSSYDNGGNLSRAADYGSKSHPYAMVKSEDFAGPHRSYPIPTRSNAVDALRLAGLHHDDAVKDKVYAKYPDLKKYNGGYADSGASIQPISSNPYSPSQTMMFNGPSHEQGGIPINYGGNNIEVEGGETGHVDDSGNLVIGGNMNYPGTNKKFKDVLKGIADQENKINKISGKASDLSSSVIDPNNKFDMLKSNSAQLMQTGSDMKLQQLAEQKQHIAMIQQAMLDTAHKFNIDPQAMSKGVIKNAAPLGKKAKNGKTVKYYDDGGVANPGDGGGKKGTLSDKNNNPGNIKLDPNSKYGKLLMQKYGAVVGDRSSDGGFFARFPDRDSGSLAMKNLLTQGDKYKNSTVEGAINTWTNGNPYNLSGLGNLKNTKISDLSPDELNHVLGYMQKGEGTRYPTTSVPSNNPYQTLPPINIEGKRLATTSAVEPYNPQVVSPTTPITSVPKFNPVETSPFTPETHKQIPSNKENLAISQLYPEMYAAAANARQPVRLQQYDPQLEQPYQVSFQDRLNENNASFRGMENLNADDPTAVSTLAGQKYAADSSVLADEFRQNDSQNRGIYNNNINTLNSAQMTNLQLADQQYVRQSEANSKTKSTDEAILNSIASKYAQNNLENKQLQAAESFSGYRFNDQGQLEYQGPDASFRYGNAGSGNSGNTSGYVAVPWTKTQVKTSGLGMPEGTQVTQMARVEKQLKDGGKISSLYNKIYGKNR